MSASSEWTRLAPRANPLGDGENWNVFLSYRSVDRRWVLNLYDVLRDHGHQVFLDQCVLKGGDELIRRLEEALASSQAGVLAWSSASRDSDWVYREYQAMERQADRRDFQFVPVRLDDDELPGFAQNRIFLDFAAYPDGPNGGELLRLLHAVVGEPLSEEAARFASEQDEAAHHADARIDAAILNGHAERLVQLFEQGGLPWESSAALGCKAAEGLTKLDRPAQAIDMLEALQERFPSAIRPKQLRALALARRREDGDLEAAQDILGELYARGERDPETLGIYARTWMDRHERSGDIHDLEQSRDLYAEAFEAAGDDYYTGINAAAKSVFLGTERDLAKAAGYAERVQAIVGTEPTPGNYWATATAAEAFLIEQEFAEAARLYRAAVAMARQERGSHKTTWLQARRLMERLSPANEEREDIRDCFSHLPEARNG